jgi:hypothetical protein
MTRKSFKDTLRENDAAQRGWAAMYGKPVNPEWLNNVQDAKPRAARKASGEPSEAQILKAIMALLHRHPKVGRAWRQNSGTAQYESGGKTRYVRANTAKGMSDIMGILKDGRTLAIEVKSAKGVVMAHQHEFLNSIAKAGGIAFVARSVDDVITRLERV